MSRQILFGAHRVVFEDPDLVTVDLRGYVGDEYAALMDTVVSWSLGRPYILVLIPLGQTDGMSPLARKVLRAPDPRMPPRAIATYGGGFATRVGIDMLMRATALLGPHRRLLFHGKDEAEARAWLAGARDRLGRCVISSGDELAPASA